MRRVEAGMSLCHEKKILRVFSMLKGRKWKGVLSQHEDAVQAIRDGGFVVELREGLLELPVVLKAEDLSAALSDDVSTAFGPLRDAVARVIELKPRFDELVAAARAVAYE